MPNPLSTEAAGGGFSRGSSGRQTLSPPSPPPQLIHNVHRGAALYMLQTVYSRNTTRSLLCLGDKLQNRRSQGFSFN
ncbi:Uncharacterized protein DAT39_021586 [Clarias magur]|uniref:Uncharacterized protein n=1 Tax=Clarias magur TaxID=1594786 RepID=A0A8J4WQE4_CLAMG|nr:Uncharacterized protein DAT39_021586 [Clarias magur]